MKFWNRIKRKKLSKSYDDDNENVIRYVNVNNVYSNKSVRQVRGVGAKTENILNQLGIKTIGDLGDFDVDEMNVDDYRIIRGVLTYKSLKKLVENVRNM